MQALEVLRTVDFDWTRHLDSIWSDAVYHIPDLHAEELANLVHAFKSISRDSNFPSPLGLVVMGPAGSGKTHLLGALRQEIVSRDGWFILVDMTDVHDFWETTRLGFLNSLQKPLPKGEYQFQRLVRALLKSVPDVGDPAVKLRELAEVDSERMIAGYVNRIALPGIARRFPRETRAYKDVLRALFLLNADSFLISEVGYGWLQGVGVEDDEKVRYGFASRRPAAVDVIRGLSWAMGLDGPTLLAFDQIDAIVAQHNIASLGIQTVTATEEERTSAAIIQGIAGGFMALRDNIHQTLTVVSCLEETWHILKERAVDTFADRFRSPWPLPALGREEIATEIVKTRLNAAFQHCRFQPPYSSWPFKPQAFATAVRFLPRELLKRCDAHLRHCIAKGSIDELKAFTAEVEQARESEGADLSILDERFSQLKAEADPKALTDPDNEDGIADDVLEAACRCLLKENPTRDNVDTRVDEDFAVGKHHHALHARVRLIYRSEGDREKHYSFRVLQKRHHKSFQSRLKAAMTASGIDKKLDFRRLVIIRNTPLPGGSVTDQMVQEFETAGGVLVAPSDDEWRALCALTRMEEEGHTHLETWLRKRKPVCQLAIMARARVCEDLAAVSPTAVPSARQKTPSHAGSETRQWVVDKAIGQHRLDLIPVGYKVVGVHREGSVTLQVQLLPKHTVVLAGAGSGKTVLVRRIVEEAALVGIPAIVIDPANDLARLGDAWPQPPAAWGPGDSDKARRYFDTVEVAVWTPGLEKGNPLHLEPLPDLAAVADDHDELQTAVMLAHDALRETVAPGTSAAAKSKKGVLAAALKFFAQHEGGGLADFVDLLSDLPPEAGGGIGNSQKLAQQMADHLRAEIQTNVLLQSHGQALDPARLFGLDADKTRVSVINLNGLPGLDAQRGFVSQLAMTLFTWIKRHPAPTEHPIRGLLVVDEAKDFVPSGKQVSSREPMLRLAAQARKYGLGLVFATQAPKSIDHQVIANCSTHFYGKAISPAAIEVIQEQLKQRGSTGHDVPTLEPGRFYFYTEGLPAPTKISAPMCLSHHPATPLDADGVLERAAKCKRIT